MTVNPMDYGNIKDLLTNGGLVQLPYDIASHSSSSTINKKYMSGMVLANVIQILGCRSIMALSKSTPLLLLWNDVETIDDPWIQVLAVQVLLGYQGRFRKQHRWQCVSIRREALQHSHTSHKDIRITRTKPRIKHIGRFNTGDDSHPG